MKGIEDAILLKNFTEKDRVYVFFFAGLNLDLIRSGFKFLEQGKHHP